MMVCCEMRYRQRYLAVIICITVVCFWILFYLQSSSKRSKQTISHAVENSNFVNDETSSLTAKQGSFFLRNKPIRIFSGSIHYWRVPAVYWEDRLLKLKACGLNTVDTYVVWNLHEETRGKFDFTGLLNIRSFVELAHKVGLYVILRPGPYICSEWEFGGLPSWLLSYRDMKVRSTNKNYMDAVTSFFQRLFTEIKGLQYSEGGPIIAYQIENEFGVFANDKPYLEALKKIYLKNGVKEFLFTCGNNDGLKQGSLSDVFAAVNFFEANDGAKLMDQISRLQPNIPIFVSEYWTGWFDSWSQKHHVVQVDRYLKNLIFILEKETTSVNLYMFLGGTNFGFMNGANSPHHFTTTSYDYDALLTENGQVTAKYLKTQKLLHQYRHFEDVKLPKSILPHAYGSIRFDSFLPLKMIINQVSMISSMDVLPMEYLPINNNGGQGYGFTLYSNTIAKGEMIKFLCRVYDRALVFVNDVFVEVVEVVDVTMQDKTVSIKHLQLQDKNKLDILVENMGRFNYFKKDTEYSHPRKGLLCDVQLDNSKLKDWKIYPLEFKKDFMSSLSVSELWKPITPDMEFPAVLRAKFTMAENIQDTFISTKGLKKGAVFINGFNLGRYWDMAPQKTLYLPAPFMKEGINELMIFELHQASNSINLTDKADLGTT